VSDLYATLGVPRSATADEIRKAYVAAAKRIHPDAGGGAVEFVELQAAYDVLSDPERRQRYDETGDTDADADNATAMALELACQVLAKVLSEVQDPTRVDLVARMVSVLSQAAIECEQAAKAAEANAQRLEKVVKRFKRKSKKPSPLVAMLQKQINQLGLVARAQRGELPKITRAIEVVRDHEFKWDRPAPTNTSTTFIIGGWR
jgi:curved DNA-binding protein CbpA